MVGREAQPLLDSGACPERKRSTAPELPPLSEPTSPVKSVYEQSYFTEFAKVVYRRLRVYRGIYIFYSIVTFMLGLPVMVTGFKKQFFSNEHFDMLYCPHYLGIISLLSCFISLWTAFKNQIVICVLTLVTGIITVISAMIVLVTSALALSETSVQQTADLTRKHLNQQTHVIFIFSIGLLVASLAIVITALSHLSARRVKRVKTAAPIKVHLPEVEEKKIEVEETIECPDPGAHRFSFASTISSLIKQELKENKAMDCETKAKLKKTLSCPSERCKTTADLLDRIVPPGNSCSTHSLPTQGAEYRNAVVARWSRASLLAKYYSEEVASAERDVEAGEVVNERVAKIGMTSASSSVSDIHAHESVV